MTADQYTKANTAYSKAVKQNDAYGPAWYNLAKSHMELDEYQKAGDAFIAAYDRYDPKRPDILYYAASTYLAADQPAEALTVFNRLTTLHPEDIKLDWQQLHARILLANNKPAAALPIIEKLAKEMQGRKNKKNGKNFYSITISPFEMDNKALAYARNLTKTAPLEIRWWKALVQITLSMERYKEALVALTVYGHLTPLSIDEKKLMADLYLMLDIPGQSTAVLEELLAANTDTAFD